VLRLRFNPRFSRPRRPCGPHADESDGARHELEARTADALIDDDRTAAATGGIFGYGGADHWIDPERATRRRRGRRA
jgi:hypothetical protein